MCNTVTSPPDHEPEPTPKKPKMSRKSIAEALESKIDAMKEVRLRELELEERRLKLQEEQQKQSFELEKLKAEQTSRQQSEMVSLLRAVTTMIAQKESGDKQE